MPLTCAVADVDSSLLDALSLKQATDPNSCPYVYSNAIISFANPHRSPASSSTALYHLHLRVIRLDCSLIVKFRVDMVGNKPLALQRLGHHHYLNGETPRCELRAFQLSLPPLRCLIEACPAGIDCRHAATLATVSVSIFFAQHRLLSGLLFASAPRHPDFRASPTSITGGIPDEHGAHD